MKTPNKSNRSHAITNMLKPAAFAALFLFVFTTSDVHAANKIPAPPVEIKYLGSLNYKPVFEINFDNQDGEDVYLTLKDEDGNVIYSDIVKDKKYSRKIQLDNSELYNMKLTLNLRSKKINESQNFSVNSNTRIVENVEVVKL